MSPICFDNFCSQLRTKCKFHFLDNENHSRNAMRTGCIRMAKVKLVQTENGTQKQFLGQKF